MNGSVDYEKQSSSSSSVLAYHHLCYEVKGKDGGVKRLVDDISVEIRAGELLAIMGPSGAGKSTLLDLMAFRKPALGETLVYLNNQRLSKTGLQKISTFVEQEDALLGVLTVRESVTYALKLHLPLLPRKEVNDRVERVIRALGLQACADQRIGTPISRGISGGQKRRVTAACAMVTFPRILLLDEVTSGLDSTSAREVMSAIRTLAVAEGMIVLATIHQPSLETLAQFTNVMFLSQGKTCFSGRVDELDRFFEKWGKPVPRFVSISPLRCLDELLMYGIGMNFLNNDFSAESGASPNEFRDFYLTTLGKVSGRSSSEATAAAYPPQKGMKAATFDAPVAEELEKGKAGAAGTLFWNTVTLSERNARNYTRNLLAYGVRAGMYAGMGLMLATIWIRLGDSDSTINDRLSVHFYSVAFLAFMSVAGIPSFLEERAVYYRETKNGLYTTLPFVLANTLVNIPFLFFCVLIFSVICYWAIGLHPGGGAFFRFLAFLFLSILTAESQVLVITSLLPIFVAALAIGAFMNGFWMSVGGYFIKARSLPRFWFYSFHFMDYQKYAFELLTNSDLRGISFKCNTIVNNACVCAYPSSTPATCTVSGADVLEYLDVGGISYGKWCAIIVCINIIYRIALYFALKLRSS